MGILIAVFVVLLVVLGAVVFGCLWLLPLAALLALVGFALWTAWSWAGRIARHRGGAGAWWTANRQRIQATALIFGSIVLAVIIIWCLWARYAPKCTGGGCWSSMTTSSTAAGGDIILKRTLTVGSAWSEWVELPRNADFIFDREGHNLPYMIEVRRSSGPGDTYTVPADPVNDKRTPCERYTSVQLGGYVDAIRFRMIDPGVETAKFNIAFYQLGSGPCS